MGDIITIDGPASSGKSTIGLLFAQKIGYQFIDSGIFYRSCAYYLLKHLPDLNNEDKNTTICKDLEINVKTDPNRQQVFLNGEDISSYIRTPEIDQASSVIAKHPRLREIIKQIQKTSAKEGKFVVAGRDIGTEIFPDAPLKFYITASAEERAKRRYKELTNKGSSISYQEVLEEIKQRDLQDSTRQASPLRIPSDAKVVDTTDLPIEGVINKLYSFYTPS